MAMRIGMLKTSIRMYGGCLSNAMDEYFDLEKIRVEFGKKMISRCLFRPNGWIIGVPEVILHVLQYY